MSDKCLSTTFFFFYSSIHFWYFRQGAKWNPTGLALWFKINTSLFANYYKHYSPPAHPGWESSPWCPSVTLWPLVALLLCCPYTLGLLSPDQAWGQTFWEVKGQGMRWWCHSGCRRVARGVGGGLSRGSQSHTRLTVLCSQPVGTQCWTELPLMALSSAWWLAII